MILNNNRPRAYALRVILRETFIRTLATYVSFACNLECTVFRPAVASSALEGVNSGHHSMVGWDGFPWRGKGRRQTVEAEEAQQTTAVGGTPNQPSRMGLNFLPS